VVESGIPVGACAAKVYPLAEISLTVATMPKRPLVGLSRYRIVATLDPAPEKGIM